MVTLEQIKNILRVDTDEDDAYLELLMKAAEEYIIAAVGAYPQSARADILAAFLVGLIVEKSGIRGYGKYLIAAFGGFVVTYAIGLVYKYMMLNYYVGEKTAFAMVLADCFPLDMPGDMVLCFLAAGLAVRLVPASRSILGTLAE